MYWPKQMLRVFARSYLLICALLANGVQVSLAAGTADVVRLTVAVKSMQAQAQDDFVIVEIPGSSNYVQLAGVDGGGYVFDVPLRSLTPDQQRRALPFFASRGVGVVTTDATDPTTNESFAIQTYQKYFRGDDPGGGAALSVDFVHEVLRHSGELRIVRGWR